MKSGVLGLVNGNKNELDSFERINQQNEREYKACVEILREHTDGSTLIQFGRAAIEKPTTKESINISNGSISVGERSTTETQYTEFVFIPGEFAIVTNNSGRFAFDLFTSHLPGVEVVQGEIDLNRHLESIPEAVAWQVGFYGNVGEAEKGTVYGDNVLQDNEVGSVMETCEKNQIGIILDLGSEKIKYTMTESGYIEIYQPSNYEEKEFVSFIADYVLPYTRKKEI